MSAGTDPSLGATGIRHAERSGASVLWRCGQQGLSLSLQRAGWNSRAQAYLSSQTSCIRPKL
jgi:hypothetical protein